MSKIVLYIFSIGFVLLIVFSIQPYVANSFIKAELKNGALYGTKHTIDDTYVFLNKELSKKDIIFDPDEINIVKDNKNNVSIRFVYQDKISLFGIVLKELEFKLDVTEQNTKMYS